MERKEYLDFLKGISIFAVIVIHVTTEGLCRDLSTVDSVWYNLFYILARFSVPVFLMVTGVLLLNPKKELSLKKLYSKYILDIIIAAFIWGFVYKLVNMFCGGSLGQDVLTILRNYLGEFITGKLEFHFWYVYAIVGIYISVPILRAFVKAADKKTLEYFIVIWIVFNTLYILTKGGYFEFITNISDNFHHVGIFVSFMGYLILGYYLDTYDMNKIQTTIIFISGIIGLVACGSMTIYDSLSYGMTRIEYTSYICPGIILYAMAFYKFFKSINCKYESVINKIVCRIGKNTMGIYFMHMIFIIVFLRSRMLSDIIYAPIDIIVYSVVVLLISWGIQELLSKIPIAGRWL